MAGKYGNYTELRDIANKRAKRLAAAGLAPEVHIPTVKELKARGVSPAAAIKSVESYLKADTTLTAVRKATELPRFVPTESGVVVTSAAEEKKVRQREQARKRSKNYRERLKNLTKKDKSYMKAAKTLGVYIPPSQAKAFTEYLAFRFSVGADQLKYAINEFIKDFDILVHEKKHKAEFLLKDFNQYALDRAALEERGQAMSGYSYGDVNGLFRDMALE